MSSLSLCTKDQTEYLEKSMQCTVYRERIKGNREKSGSVRKQLSSVKQLKSNIAAYRRCLIHTISWSSHSLLRMSWVGSDEEGRVVGQTQFSLDDVTSVDQKFSNRVRFAQVENVKQ